MNAAEANDLGRLQGKKTINKTIQEGIEKAMQKRYAATCAKKATMWPTPPIREGSPEPQGGRKKGKPVPEEKVVR